MRTFKTTAPDQAKKVGGGLVRKSEAPELIRIVRERGESQGDAIRRVGRVVLKHGFSSELKEFPWTKFQRFPQHPRQNGRNAACSGSLLAKTAFVPGGAFCFSLSSLPPPYLESDFSSRISSIVAGTPVR